MYTITETDDALTVEGAGEPIDLWDRLRRHYLQRRPGRRGSGGLRYPETTRREVLAIVTIFNRELAHGTRDVAGLATETTTWRRTARRAADADGDLDEMYDDNPGFWQRDTKRLAVFLTVSRYLPTRTEMMNDLAALSRRDTGSGSKP
ncbi:MAG: hypothetical protein KC464_10350 [Myxococcales bacterium]|nr:hypothetical protein [Myxococcales bacterium]